MIFEDHLIQQGEAGGKEAAHILWAAVRDYVQHTIPMLSSDYKIVARVYANLKGLGDICSRAGILDNPIIMEDFMRGFTGSKQLFDFIDVGSGKDRADDKISGESRKAWEFGYLLRRNRIIQALSIQLSLPSYNIRMLS
jgi:hypothetical protein